MGQMFLGSCDKVRGEVVKEIERCFAFWFCVGLFFFHFSCCNNPMTLASFGFIQKLHQSLFPMLYM